MSVYRRGKLWRYDFWFHGVRHTSQHAHATRADAEEAEASLKRTLRRRAAGLEALDAKDTPLFTDWAWVTFEWQRDRKKLKQPDEAKNTLRMVLAFWGAQPTLEKPVPGGEYRNLRLGDPIQQPELIEAFERWMSGRNLSGPRKNHYRSACSMMYRVALLPENRRRAGVRENPFVGVLRDRVKRRTATLTPDQIVTWLRSAPLPVVVAVSIGALAPALRFQNVVDLRRDQLSPNRDFLTVPHKADRETGLPLTVAISPELQRIIAIVEQQFPNDPFIVPLGEKRYWPLHRLIRQSITDAGLLYGRRHDAGITFHSLRHAASTWLARLGVSQAERQRALGHQTPQMAAWYTHLGGADTVHAMQAIGTHLPIGTLVAQRLSGESSRQTPTSPTDSMKTKTGRSSPRRAKRRAS